MERSTEKMTRDLVIAGLAGAGLVAAFKLAARKASKYNLKGAVALITGGSRGLGLVLARELAKQGCKVAICARDEGELARAKSDLEHCGAEVEAIACDMTVQTDVDRMVGDVLYHFGRIDVLVNVAGIIRMAPFELQTKEDFQEAMNTHFWGPYYSMTAVLPTMMKQGSGRIANISSIGGKIPIPHLSSYCASKFALTGLSSSLRSELLKYGVYVTTVCPGLMRTGSIVNAEFKGQNEKEYALFGAMGSSPLTTVSAENAARQIVKSIRDGDAELIISPQAKLAAKFSALFPGLTADLLAITDRFLPSAASGDLQASTGLESRSALSPPFLTARSDSAAVQNNELKPGERLS